MRIKTTPPPQWKLSQNIEHKRQRQTEEVQWRHVLRIQNDWFIYLGMFLSILWRTITSLTGVYSIFHLLTSEKIPLYMVAVVGTHLEVN